MRRSIALCLVSVLCVPSIAFAAPAPVTRRDGFLLLWNSIARAVLANREKPFTDVPKGSKGFEEITYAKYRGIVDYDVADFRPNEPLMLGDALTWLFRTRSVDDIDALTADNLPLLLDRYPLGDFVDPTEGEHGTLRDRTLTEEELLNLMRKIDGLLREETHEVSLYSEKFHGKGTAFGETFDMNALTAAHRTFPWNTLVKVTNVENGKSVTVRINDRGPFVEGRDMDLSLGAFTTIADRSKGKIRATFERLGDSTLVNVCGDGAGAQVRIAGKVRLTDGLPHVMRLGQLLRFRSTLPFVIRSVAYPDGTVEKLQNWVLPGETYELTPSIEGTYVFSLGTKEGRARKMETKVVKCDE